MSVWNRVCNMNNTLDLSGKWLVRWADGQRGGLHLHSLEDTDGIRWFDAQVPGEVHLDLMNAGIIKDPCIGANCLDSRWVEEFFWSYRKEFETPDDALKCRVWLCFEGLDYSATIFLNGEEIGRHSNFFYPCNIEVSGRLRKGKNILVVSLESGLYSVSEKAVAGYFGGQSPDALLHKRMWLRKPQCSFGWDWAQRFINAGIHKPVLLEWECHVRTEQTVLLTDISDDFTQGRIYARLFVEGLKPDLAKGLLSIDISETDQHFEYIVDIKEGRQVIESESVIDKPELWWPAGQGQQAIYHIKIALILDGVTVLQEVKKTAFRKVRINQDPHPEGGCYFIVEVNNRKIFAKGANIVPADMIFARIDKERYEKLIGLALEANFNFLRVWGGGIYESDEFYDLCDEKGIMVWQDFIFACAAYPSTDECFMRNVKAEVVYNVRRLANHPSLIAWCGNNENEWHTFEQDKGVLFPDYALYHKILPEILKKEHPQCYYQPSSPFSPGQEHPNKDNIGDQHPWDIGFNDVDFRKYRNMTCRFPNEGGILGPTSLKTMHACLPEGQKHLYSFAWQLHDNGVEQWFYPSAPDKVVSEWTGKDPRKMDIEEFTYYCGLIQGEGLSEYISNFRRRKWDCSSAIFWMFNDCWPAVRSWSIVDYYLRKNPSFHHVKRSFSPISVAVVKEDDKINIYGINDAPEKWVGELRYGVFTLDGHYAVDKTIPVEIVENTSRCIATFNVEVWNETGIDHSAAFAALSDNGKLISRNRMFMPRLGELKWHKPDVKISRAGKWAVFSSAVFVWGVCLDLDGEKYLPDNNFDVWPGMKYQIPWQDDCPLPEILHMGNLVH